MTDTPKSSPQVVSAEDYRRVLLRLNELMNGPSEEFTSTLAGELAEMPAPPKLQPRVVYAVKTENDRPDLHWDWWLRVEEADGLCIVDPVPAGHARLEGLPVRDSVGSASYEKVDVDRFDTVQPVLERNYQQNLIARCPSSLQRMLAMFLVMRGPSGEHLSVLDLSSGQGLVTDQPVHGHLLHTVTCQCWHDALTFDPKEYRLKRRREQERALAEKTGRVRNEVTTMADLLRQTQQDSPSSSARTRPRTLSPLTTTVKKGGWVSPTAAPTAGVDPERTPVELAPIERPSWDPLGLSPHLWGQVPDYLAEKDEEPIGPARFIAGELAKIPTALAPMFGRLFWLPWQMYLFGGLLAVVSTLMFIVGGTSMIGPVICGAGSWALMATVLTGPKAVEGRIHRRQLRALDKRVTSGDMKCDVCGTYVTNGARVHTSKGKAQFECTKCWDERKRQSQLASGSRVSRAAAAAKAPRCVVCRQLAKSPVPMALANGKTVHACASCLPGPGELPGWVL